MNGGQEGTEERRRYVETFNTTMVEIWKEQMIKLGAVSTGNLYRSLRLYAPVMDEKVMEVMMQYSFAEYGIYVDRGTGGEIFRGNAGDVGRAVKRKKKPWFSKKFFSSYANLRDFFAEATGREFTGVLPKVLTGD